MNFNLGTQDKKKTIIAGSLGGFALIFFIYQMYSLFGGSTPPPVSTTTVTTSTSTVTPVSSRSVSTTNAVVSHGSTSGAAVAAAGQAGALANAQASGSQSQNPALRLDLLALSEHTVYTGTGRNVFSAAAPPPPIEKVTAPIRPVAPVEAVDTGPPPPPPIDLQFYGFATSRGQKKRVFLKHGDDIFIASEGDIVNHRYRVKQVTANSVMIEDILNNNTQPVPLSMQIAG